MRQKSPQQKGLGILSGKESGFWSLQIGREENWVWNVLSGQLCDPGGVDFSVRNKTSHVNSWGVYRNNRGKSANQRIHWRVDGDWQIVTLRLFLCNPHCSHPFRALEKSQNFSLLFLLPGFGNTQIPGFSWDSAPGLWLWKGSWTSTISWWKSWTFPGRTWGNLTSLMSLWVPQLGHGHLVPQEFAGASFKWRHIWGRSHSFAPKLHPTTQHLDLGVIICLQCSKGVTKQPAEPLEFPQGAFKGSHTSLALPSSPRVSAVGMSWIILPGCKRRSWKFGNCLGLLK